MAEVAHVFICDRAYEDDRGQPCVIGLHDHIRATEFPLTQRQMVIALQMIGHQHERCEVLVEVLDPKHRVIQSVQNEVPALLSDIGQGFLPLALSDASFEVPGRYTVRISSEGRVVASRPLILEQVAA